MGWYGTLLLARPGNGCLPAYPGVQQAFGPQFCVPNPPFGNPVGLYDLDDGWQRVGVWPSYRRLVVPLRLAAGVEQLTAATAAPVLAAWVSESVCAHLEARTPAGVAVSMHLPNIDENCGYKHLDGRPGRMEPRRAVEAFEAWSIEAGRTPATETIAAVVHGTWENRPAMEDKVLALVAALGFPPGREILPVINDNDEAFGDYGIIAHRADHLAAELIHAAAKGWVLGPEYGPSEMELDYLRFSDLLGGSIYGGGLSREELIAEYEHLTSRWPDR